MRATLLDHARSHGPRAAWAVAEQGIYPFTQLLLTPFLLRRLAREEFATWMLAVTILSLSQLVSFGASYAATKHVAADLAIGAQAAAVGAVRAALSVALLGGALAAALSWVLAPEIAARLFSHVGPMSTVAPVLALCGLLAAVQEIDNVYAGALRGAERFDLCARVEVAARLAMTGALAYAAYHMASVRTLALLLLAMMIVKAALKARQVVLLLGTADCLVPTRERVALSRVLNFGSWQWLQAAGTAFFSAADQLLVGGLLGASALTRYSVCLQIAQYVHTLPSVMMQVIFPRLSALGSRISAADGNYILRMATLMGVGAAVLLGVPLIVLAHPILKLWIGADFADQNSILLMVLVVVYITLAVNVGAYFVLLGSGRTAASALIVLAAGVVQLIAVWFLAPLGIMYIACSRFIYSIGTAFLYRAARYQTHVS
jgi:O-antigen/teichoic acid export membrane protein